MCHQSSPPPNQRSGSVSSVLPGPPGSSALLCRCHSLHTLISKTRQLLLLLLRKGPASTTVKWGKYRLPWGHGDTLGGVLAEDTGQCIRLGGVYNGGASRMLLQIHKDVKPQRSTNRRGAVALKRTCSLKCIARVCVFQVMSRKMTLVCFFQSNGVEGEVSDGAVFKMKRFVLPRTCENTH